MATVLRKDATILIRLREKMEVQKFKLKLSEIIVRNCQKLSDFRSIAAREGVPWVNEVNEFHPMSALYKTFDSEC